VCHRVSLAIYSLTLSVPTWLCVRGRERVQARARAQSTYLDGKEFDRLAHVGSVSCMMEPSSSVLGTHPADPIPVSPHTHHTHTTHTPHTDHSSDPIPVTPHTHHTYTTHTPLIGSDTCPTTHSTHESVISSKCHASTPSTPSVTTCLMQHTPMGQADVVMHT